MGIGNQGGSLDIRSVRARITVDAGRLGPFLEELRIRLDDYPDQALWINRVPWEKIQARASALEQAWSQGQGGFLRFPLFGVPFAVKDNIDVEGIDTTAACPAFAYRPETTATAVARLEAAGAILIGKTNMDQFATGLVGTRSPYGTVRNPFHAGYLPGGSSSGSAVAVAAGLVSFALGTDTAGSGRVPAGFNNVVGIKPSRGVISAHGVFPACRSLDCVSVFALTCEDAFQALEHCRGVDPLDAFSRPVPADRIKESFSFSARAPGRFQFGVPDAAHLEFCGDEESAALFREAEARLTALGGMRVEIPFATFAETARLLYQGPWLAERKAAFGDFLAKHPGDVLPVIREIMGRAEGLTAEDAFRAFYRLEELRARAASLFRGMDVLLVPTAPTHFTRQQVEADPIALNSKLGTYTNFVNLLDLCALAVPAGGKSNGLPFGVTLIAPAFHEAALASLASAFHAATGLPLGATTHSQPALAAAEMPAEAAADSQPVTAQRSARLAVAGLHLSGQPLNHQLLELGARLAGTFRTVPRYRLYALERPGRRFPGIVRAESGAALELEVWEMTPAALGAFLERVIEPLCIGTLELESGEKVKGFLCEGWAVADALDITQMGSWRAFLAKR